MEGIKEKIGEMKAQCFPTLSGRREDDSPEEAGAGSGSNSNLFPPTMVSGNNNNNNETSQDASIPSLNEYAALFGAKAKQFLNSAAKVWKLTVWHVFFSKVSLKI